MFGSLQYLVDKYLSTVFSGSKLELSLRFLNNLELSGLSFYHLPYLDYHNKLNQSMEKIMSVSTLLFFLFYCL